MPTAFPPESDLFPAGALAPATAKTKWQQFFQAVTALLGTSGLPADARTALGLAAVASSGSASDLTVGTLPAARGGTGLSGALRSYLAGLGMSTAGSSTTMTIAAGVAADSGNAVLMTLAASINKTTSSWAAGSGNGGLDTGAIANNTWYHFYQVAKADGTTDVLFSLSVSAPTMPTGYIYKRRIGSGRTNGSGQWTKFIQDGDVFQWDVPVADVNTSSTAANRTLYTLSVPTGVRVQANVSVAHFSSVTATHATLLTDPSTADTAPGLSAFTIAGSNQTSGASHGGMASIYTDTSARIGARSTFVNTLNINTHGWVDRRGREA